MNVSFACCVVCVQQFVIVLLFSFSAEQYEQHEKDYRWNCDDGEQTEEG